MAERPDDIDRLVEALKEPVRISPDLTTRVMAEITPMPDAPASSARGPERVSWIRRRWTIRVSPLGALGLAGVVAVLLFAGSRVAGPPRALPTATAEPEDAVRSTQFVLVAPRAGAVTLVGDFNDWNPAATPLARSEGDGVWWVTIPLSPGRYRYAFLVDGTTWLADPEAPAVEEEFGRPNSVVTIGGD